MTCEACVRDNDNHAKYCCECGTGLIGQPESPDPAPVGVWSDRARRCVNCEETIPARSRFCQECGMAATLVTGRDVRSRALVGGLMLGVFVIACLLADLSLPRYLSE